MCDCIKHQVSRLILSVGSVIALAATASALDPLVNPGFEDTFSGSWLTYSGEGGLPLTRLPIEAYTGDYSLRMTPWGTVGDDGYAGAFQIRLIEPSEIGQEVTFSGWVKGEAADAEAGIAEGSKMRFALEWRGPESFRERDEFDMTPLGGPVLLTDEYQFMEFTAVVPVGADQVRPILTRGAGADTFYVDDVSLTIAPAGLSGDYNDDGVVDAADYTVWRDNLGDSDESDLSDNGDGLNGVDPADYALWANSYGNTAAAAAEAIPEPASLGLMMSCVVVLAARAGRRS